MKNDRRALLKALTLGTGAVGAAKLPTVWTKPVVDSVALPAHAQTTASVLSGRASLDLALGGAGQGLFHQYAGSDGQGGLLRRLIPDAHAGELGPVESASLEAYVEPRGPGEYYVEVLAQFEVAEENQTQIIDDNQLETRLDKPEGGILDSMIGKAHAQPSPTCYSSVLWTTTIAVSGDPASGGKNDVKADDTCGIPVDEEGVNVDLELTIDSPTNGFLRIEVAPINESIKLSEGGSRLSVDCKGEPCEFIR